MKKQAVNKAEYEAPGTVYIPVESNCLICLSDGEHEGTGEEPWD